MYSYETNDFKDLRSLSHKNQLFLNNSTSFSPKNQNENTIFFPLEPLNEITKNIGLIGVYKSASITFYSKDKGYLLCQEIRDNKLVFHPIGGKCEKNDESIEYTAIREFIEETGILKNDDFISLFTKNKEIETVFLEKDATNFIYDILLNSNITNYYDFYVNIDKEYIHKYYLINMDKCEEDFKKIIKNMDIFYANTFKEIGNNDEYITGLVWNKEINKGNLNKRNYSMLTIYLSNVIKSHKNNIFNIK